MNIKDKINVVGRVKNQGLPFNLELEVIGLSNFGMVLLENPLNNDNFNLNLPFGRIESIDGSELFYSDDFNLFNITQNIRII